MLSNSATITEIHTKESLCPTILSWSTTCTDNGQIIWLLSWESCFVLFISWLVSRIGKKHIVRFMSRPSWFSDLLYFPHSAKTVGNGRTRSVESKPRKTLGSATVVLVRVWVTERALYTTIWLSSGFLDRFSSFLLLSVSPPTYKGRSTFQKVVSSSFTRYTSSFFCLVFFTPCIANGIGRVNFPFNNFVLHWVPQQLLM